MQCGFDLGKGNIQNPKFTMNVLCVLWSGIIFKGIPRGRFRLGKILEGIHLGQNPIGESLGGKTPWGMSFEQHPRGKSLLGNIP